MVITSKEQLRDLFIECREKYFKDKGILPIPPFKIDHCTQQIAHFQWIATKRKRPIRKRWIIFSDFFDLTEKQLVETMVHEMIHYYLVYNHLQKSEDLHGEEFQTIAKEMKDKYNLDIHAVSDWKDFATAPRVSKTRRWFAKWFRI